MLVAYQNFWRQSFDFKNRSSRSDYWWAFLINLIIYLVLMTTFLFSSGFSAALTADVDHFSAVTWLALILLFVWGFASIVPISALAMRRIRDTGLSPFLWLVFPVSIILGEFTQIWAMIISGVLAIVYLIFTLLPSKPDKMKPNSQIKGSLIVTTGLLVLIIFSVGHLPAKAEQIVYGNPTQPVVNGEMNQIFVQRFDDAVTLDANNQYIVDKAKLPKNASQTELNTFYSLISDSNKELKVITKLVPESAMVKKDDTITITGTAPDSSAPVSGTAYSPNSQDVQIITLVAAKKPAPKVVPKKPVPKKVAPKSNDSVKAEKGWWGTKFTTYSVNGTKNLATTLTKTANNLQVQGATFTSGVIIAGSVAATPIVGAILSTISGTNYGVAVTRFNNAAADLRNKIDQGKTSRGVILDMNKALPGEYSLKLK